MRADIQTFNKCFVAQTELDVRPITVEPPLKQRRKRYLRFSQSGREFDAPFRSKCEFVLPTPRSGKLPRREDVADHRLDLSDGLATSWGVVLRTSKNHLGTQPSHFVYRRFVRKRNQEDFQRGEFRDYFDRTELHVGFFKLQTF